MSALMSEASEAEGLVFVKLEIPIPLTLSSLTGLEFCLLQEVVISGTYYKIVRPVATNIG